VPNNHFNQTAPFGAVCATRYARLSTNRANPLRGTGLLVKCMFGRRFAPEEQKNTLKSKQQAHYDSISLHESCIYRRYLGRKPGWKTDIKQRPLACLNEYADMSDRRKGRDDDVVSKLWNTDNILQPM